MTREEIFEKLKLNGGDIKSVHGDSGHVQMKMRHKVGSWRFRACADEDGGGRVFAYHR